MTAHASGETVLATVSILAAFTTLAVVCRLYTRLCLVRNGGVDDWIIVASLVFTIGMTIGIAFEVRFGLGAPSYEQSPEELIGYRKSFWWSVWLYHLGIGLARISVIFQCMRIFKIEGCWSTRTMLAVNGAFFIWAVLSSILTCIPVERSWTTDGSGPHCLNKRVLWLSNSAMAMILDFAVAMLPLPWIKQLQLPARQKVLLAGLFAVAGLPCILAIVRLQSMLEVANAMDATLDNAILAILSANEVYVSIVCASLPSLRAWYNRIIKPHFRSSTRRLCKNWPWSSSSSSSRVSIVRPGRIKCWIQRRLPAPVAERDTARSGILGNPWDSSIELVTRERTDFRNGIHVIHEIEQEVDVQQPGRVILKDKSVDIIRTQEAQHVENGHVVRCGVLPSLDGDGSRLILSDSNSILT